ncbi:MAG: hypothetical protein AB7D57_11445, partial [Desulfovibrionaceae bacterium]
ETLAALDAPDTPDAPIRVADVSLASALVPGDLAVVFPSSAGNQAVARGIPVVEYFDYAAGDWPSFVPAEGGRTSVYRALGLALPADDPAGLAAVLGGLASDPERYRRTAEAQRRALRQALALRDDAGAAAVAALLERRP